MIHLPRFDDAPVRDTADAIKARRVRFVGGRSIDLGRFRIPRITIEDCGPDLSGGRAVRFLLEDVDNVEDPSEKTSVIKVVVMRPETANFARHLRDELLDMLAHELDEWLRVDGRQVTEPHGKARRPSPSHRDRLRFIVDDLEPRER